MGAIEETETTKGDVKNKESHGGKKEAHDSSRAEGCTQQPSIVICKVGYMHGTSPTGRDSLLRDARVPRPCNVHNTATSSFSLQAFHEAWKESLSVHANTGGGKQTAGTEEDQEQSTAGRPTGIQQWTTGLSDLSGRC
jgi:hypothetical protein